MRGYRIVTKNTLLGMAQLGSLPMALRVWAYAKLHEFKPGDSISMNTFDISREIMASRHSIQKAINLLIESGAFMVVKTVGRGVKVVIICEMTGLETTTMTAPKHVPVPRLKQPQSGADNRPTTRRGTAPKHVPVPRLKPSPLKEQEEQEELPPYPPRGKTGQLPPQPQLQLITGNSQPQPPLQLPPTAPVRRAKPPVVKPGTQGLVWDRWLTVNKKMGRARPITDIKDIDRAGAIGLLIEIGELSVKDLLPLMEIYLDDQDRFLTDTGHRLAYLDAGRLRRYQEELKGMNRQGYDNSDKERLIEIAVRVHREKAKEQELLCRGGNP